MRQVQIIGEAAGRITNETRVSHPEIEWSQMIGMRHRLVHDYFQIIPERVWDAVQNDIAPLIVALQTVVPPDEGDD